MLFRLRNGDIEGFKTVSGQEEFCSEKFIRDWNCGAFGDEFEHLVWIVFIGSEQVKVKGPMAVVQPRNRGACHNLGNVVLSDRLVTCHSPSSFDAEVAVQRHKTDQLAIFALQNSFIDDPLEVD